MATVLSVLTFFGFVQNIELLPAILFVVGIILLVVEAFVPGFGIAGGTGVVLILIGIFMTAESTLEFLAMLAILFGLIGLLLLAFWWSAKRGLISRKIILWNATRRQDGYSATVERNDLVGAVGVATTVLRPAGTAEINGERLDVVTDGIYLNNGTQVRVARVSGRRIVVEEVEAPAAPGPEEPDPSGTKAGDCPES